MSLTRSTQSVVHRLRLAMLVVTLLSLFSLDLARPTPGLAKEFDVIGTVDCGIPSGRRCDLDDTLVLLTDSVSGLNELVAIDISGIKRKLPALDQDDEITLCVQTVPNDEKLRATCVISAKRREGTNNQGSSTGSREVTESRSDRGRQQDKDQPPTRPTGGGVIAVVVNQLTAAPIPGATVRIAGFTLTTDATGRVSVFFDLDPGLYPIEASAPQFFPRSQQVEIRSAETTQVTIPLQPLPGVLTGIVRSLIAGNGIPARDGHAERLHGADGRGRGVQHWRGAARDVSGNGCRAPGFISQTQPVTILPTQATTVTFNLATAFPNLNFTLVWGHPRRTSTRTCRVPAPPSRRASMRSS